MDTTTLLAAPFPNADATQEFRVITNNFDARYGFAPDAVVSIQTKSGTNDLHGGLFEFVRNYDTSANNWFSGLSDLLRRNQYGGYAGAPVIKDKLFAFANYQGTRISIRNSAATANTPTQAMLDGDFSNVKDQNGNTILLTGYLGQPNPFQDCSLPARSENGILVNSAHTATSGFSRQNCPGFWYENPEPQASGVRIRRESSRQNPIHI